MARGTRWGTSVAIAIVLRAGTAGAAPTSKLTYVRGPGAETCGNEAELRRAVAERIGYDPFFPWAERSVVAQIDRTARGYHGQLRIVDARGDLLGERTLDGPSGDCGELLKSMALAISVALDDLDATTPAAPAVAATPAPLSTVESPPPNDPMPESPVERRIEEPPAVPRIRPFGVAGALGVAGTAPAPTVAFFAGGGIAAHAWSTALEGRVDLPASDALPGRGRFETSLVLVSFVPCARFEPLAFCAVGSVGSFHAASNGVSAPQASSALYTALGGRAVVDLRIASWIGVFFSGEVVFPLRPYRADLNDREVYVTPIAAVAIGAGLAVSP